ncbi:MAG TPA: hypothetical protein ENK25_07370 [Bacteroidetes bacterium]|nr:hypothetical protein [Bacteroidota bacterium]
MLKAFQGFQPKQVINITLLGIFFWLPAFLFPLKFPSPIVLYPSPASPVMEPIARLSGFTAAVVSFIFWFLTGYLQVFMNTKHLFLKTRTLLPLFFILTLSTPVLGFFELNNLNLTFPILLIALHLVFGTYRNNNVDFSFFSAALWVGLASLICVKTSVFLIILWIALVTIRPFYFREWFASLAGFFTPWFFLFGIHFLLSDEIFSLETSIANDFMNIFRTTGPDNIRWTFLSFLGVLLLISSVQLLFTIPGLKIKTRKFYGVLFWIIMVSVVMFILFSSMWLSFIPLFSLFFSVIVSFYFLTDKVSLMKRILFDLYLAGLLIILIVRIF